MPLYEGVEKELRDHIQELFNSGKPPIMVIGKLTDKQFKDINTHRKAEGLPELENAEILYIGRHHYESRSSDGYNADDLFKQIEHGLSADSEFKKNPRRPHGTVLNNPNARNDGYGNSVYDNAVLELTARKPRAELYSVIPKNDRIKPSDQN